MVGNCPADGLCLDLVSTDDRDTLRDPVEGALPKGRIPVSPLTQSFIVMDCIVLGTSMGSLPSPQTEDPITHLSIHGHTALKWVRV